jgi:hypothetical protein
MTPVTLHQNTKYTIPCPDCGATDQFCVDHLFGKGPRSFGPWACGKCGIKIAGQVAVDNTVSIELLDKPRDRPGLLLVQIAYDGYEQPGKEPIYLVFESTIYEFKQTETGEIEEDSGYYVNEHTCPTNILRNLAIIEGTDADPHGVLRFVQEVYKPENFEKHSTRDYGDWCMIFDKLEGATIEGNQPKVIALPKPA